MDAGCDRPGLDRPTGRELEVLELVADGLANGDIARRLFITERTVKFHLSGLRRKLRARDRAHLIALSFRTGLLSVDRPQGQSGPAQN